MWEKSLQIVVYLLLIKIDILFFVAFCLLASCKNINVASTLLHTCKIIYSHDNLKIKFQVCSKLLKTLMKI